MLKNLIAKYKNKLRSDIALIAFSLLSYFTTKLLIINNLLYNLLPLFPISIIIITTLYLTIKELIVRYQTKIQLVDYIKTAHYQCNILNKKGDLNVISKVTIRNISANILIWLPEENIRLGNPTRSKIPSTVSTLEKTRKILIDYSYSCKEKIDNRPIYNYVWRPKLEPGLERNSFFSYEWTINKIEKCESDAFKNKGFFHIKINQFFDKFSAEIIAPPNFKILLLEKYVSDFNNQRCPRETKRMSKPIFNEVQNIMKVTQFRPLPKTLYIYKYGLELLK